MKRVFLYAYDKVNLGDDLFIRTIVNRYPDIQFYLWSNKLNQKIFKDCNNLKVINKESKFISILSNIRPSLNARYQEGIKKRCNAVVYIGGSIFMEYPSWRNIVNWWKYQNDHYAFYVLGANFGPYQSKEYKEAMKDVFKNMEDICFRDRYSYELFQEINTVRYAPDILFSHSMPIVKKKKKQIFISIIDCDRKEDGKFKQYRELYERVIQYITEQFVEKKYIVKLVSFCKVEGDEEAARRIKGQFINHEKYSNIQVIGYNGYNTKEIEYELASSEYVIATRFHAIILSLVAKQKVLPIIYSNKSKNMLLDIGFSGKYLDLLELDKFEMGQVYYNLKEEMMIDFTDVIKVSKQHFEKLDKVLK